jgi:hypothetical protein
MIALAGFKIMSEAQDRGQIASDGFGCVTKGHVAKWFADARAQGHTFNGSTTTRRRRTSRDGSVRKIWVIDAHTKEHVSLTDWL